MKKILFGHVLLIAVLFLWRADSKNIKPPLKVVTHTVVKPNLVVKAPAQPKSLPQPKPCSKPKSTPTPKSTPKSTPTPTKKPRSELVAMMEKSLTQLDSKPTKINKSNTTTTIGPLKSETIRYTEQLTAALQAILNFPQTDPVTIDLRLSKSGCVIDCSVIESTSDLNRDYVLAVIPTVQLPPFDKELKGSSAHNFRIKLITQKTD